MLVGQRARPKKWIDFCTSPKGKMTKKIIKIVLICIAATAPVLSPNWVYADAGLPMLAVVWPLSWFAFVPIVAIEAIIAWKFITLPWRTSLTGSLIANVISTFVGIPITWGLLWGVEMMATQGGLAYSLNTTFDKVLTVVFQAPWLMTYEKDLHWIVPAAVLFLLPFFGVASVFVERPIFRKLTKCSKEASRHWSWTANGITYGLSILAVLVWLIFKMVRPA